jgi:pimeloyl-ACP methyl ester carboxylesterase
VRLDRRLVRPGAELAFADSGPGTGLSAHAVVLTHGAGLDHSVFESQAVALAEAGYRVIVWDLRGHGDSVLDAETRFAASDALDDLEALLQECALERPVLVGHSLGGNLVQEFVRRHPARSSGLIAVDSTWNAGPLSGLERFALRLAAPALAVVPARSLPGIMAGASAVTPSAIARTEAAFARMPKPVFLDVWRATVSFVHPAAGYRSPVPLGLVRGADDRTGNIASAMARWAAAEGVDEHVIPNAGHVVTWDDPPAASRALLGILAGWGLGPAV